jgi:endonuclease/exonuclease/phosphatase (EEP) superfamily protein YafD
MSAAIRQLPVKSLRWTVNLVLSAFLTWTALNYFIQPQQLVETILRLGTVVRRMQLRIITSSLKPSAQNHSLIHISASNT